MDRHAVVELGRDRLLQHREHHAAIRADHQRADPILGGPLRLCLDDHFAGPLTLPHGHQAARNELVRLVPLAQAERVAVLPHDPRRHFHA
jgi:hypothetical protein